MLKVKERKEQPTTTQKTGCDPLSLDSAHTAGTTKAARRVGIGQAATLGGGKHVSQQCFSGPPIVPVASQHRDPLSLGTK